VTDFPHQQTPVLLLYVISLRISWAPLAQKGALIPENTDVLITHGPPFGIGDYGGLNPGREGCQDLLLRVTMVAPKLHIFGHIHQDRGRWEIGQTTFVNVTSDECLRPVTLIEYPE
jgi:Icc-related predicted phosphoesterase